MDNFFVYVKVIHLFSVIAWMAGLFYLPRLFVYHSENYSSLLISGLFELMEKRLYRFILFPALVGVWSTGLFLGYIVGFDQGWLIIKLSLVTFLSFYHFSLGYYLDRFTSGGLVRSSVFFRFLNEVPTVVLLGILILVVVKPF